MTTVRIVHIAAAIALLASGLLRTVWLLVGNRFARWSAFIPTTWFQATEIFRQAGFYLFIRREIPKVLGHNQLAAAAYLAPVRPAPGRDVTGFALDGLLGAEPGASLFGWLRELVGPQALRLVHHLAMWAILAIALFHVYSCILVDHIERNGLHVEHRQRLQVRDPRGDRRVSRRRARAPGGREVSIRRPRPGRILTRSRIERWIALLIVLNVVAVGALLATVIIDQVERLAPGAPRPGRGLAGGVARADGHGSGPHPDEQRLHPVPRDGRLGRPQGHPGHGPSRSRAGASAPPATRTRSSGRTALGHAGIAETECLNCHKVAQPGPAITQPHSRLQDQHCLDCHGSYAHLPTSMASRSEDTCTLCHKPTAAAAAPVPARARTTTSAVATVTSRRRSATCRSTMPCGPTPPVSCATRSSGSGNGHRHRAAEPRGLTSPGSSSPTNPNRALARTVP